MYARTTSSDVVMAFVYRLNINAMAPPIALIAPMRAFTASPMVNAMDLCVQHLVVAFLKCSDVMAISIVALVAKMVNHFTHDAFA